MENDEFLYWVQMISGIAMLILGGLIMLNGNLFIGLVLAGLGVGCCSIAASKWENTAARQPTGISERLDELSNSDIEKIATDNATTEKKIQTKRDGEKSNANLRNGLLETPGSRRKNPQQYSESAFFNNTAKHTSTLSCEKKVSTFYSQIPIENISECVGLRPFRMDERGQYIDDDNDRIELQPLYNPIHVWLRSNGNIEVINGRKRLKMAKRAGLRKINCRVLEEIDEVSLAEIEDFVAESSIANNEGRLIDYVRYFSSNCRTKEYFVERGLFREKKAKLAYEIAKCSSTRLLEFFNDGTFDNEAVVRIITAQSGNNDLLEEIIERYLEIWSLEDVFNELHLDWGEYTEYYN